MPESPFGSPEDWRDSDLIGVSSAFDAGLVLSAYRHGVFPMPAPRGLMGWYSPVRRGILPLDGLRVTRSLRKMARRYEIRVDTAFDRVLARCADPQRSGAWIDADIGRVYRGLHQAGVVHSVESWTQDGRLAGGLYGVSLGGLFAGESMFHDPTVGRDASKVALIGLVDLLREAGHRDRLLDVQWQTPHLETLGVVEVDRREYLRLLSRALPLATPNWRGRTIALTGLGRR
ncbi:MAG TPA: leucyl/phenylalanyl-tRNA--protein transferase [Propionibacteriaceae bacterium]|nr:leucyl/phenylalanyl-tRNA--protein transferase [Propionibacteriaceae bacterium]